VQSDTQHLRPEPVWQCTHICVTPQISTEINATHESIVQSIDQPTNQSINQSTATNVTSVHFQAHISVF